MSPDGVNGLSLVILEEIWIGWQANRYFEFLRAVNPVEDNCFDTLVYVSVYIVLQSPSFLKIIENFLCK